MTCFNEENTVEQMVLDLLCGSVTSNMVAEEPEDYPQMTQMNADEKSKNNLCPSAKSADKKRRFDIVLLVNGIPLVVGEAKTPVRPAVTWVDGASDIHNGYEQSVP